MSNTKRLIIWPQYLDCSISRKYGRKIPLSLCINKPSVEDILNACKELNLYCEADLNAKYPRVWYYTKGRVIIEFDGKKIGLLKSLARVLKEFHHKRNIERSSIHL